MTETPATYDCGDCNCEAIHDLAAERTELMEEMAAALEETERVGTLVEFNECGALPSWLRGELFDALVRVRTVLAKYRGEEGGDHAGG